MTNKPTKYKNVTVATSKVLAKFLGTEDKNIQMNFSNNKSRFIEGKHYFKVSHAEAKKLNTNDIGSEIYRGNQGLILWTERGCARHSKTLQTNEAWDLWEAMEDSYFSDSAINDLLLEAQKLKKEYEIRANTWGKLGNYLKKEKPLTINALSNAEKLSQIEIEYKDSDHD